MSREIKFRAWLPEEQLMCEVDGFDFPNKECTVWHNAFCQTQALIEDIELMQYTGLKDKNGVEIYEGDILEVVELSEGGISEYTGPVVWKDYGWIVVESENVDAPLALYDNTKKWVNGDSEIEVSGNIYENPELLNKL